MPPRCRSVVVPHEPPTWRLGGCAGHLQSSNRSRKRVKGPVGVVPGQTVDALGAFAQIRDPASAPRLRREGRRVSADIGLSVSVSRWVPKRGPTGPRLFAVSRAAIPLRLRLASRSSRPEFALKLDLRVFSDFKRDFSTAVTREASVGGGATSCVRQSVGVDHARMKAIRWNSASTPWTASKHRIYGRCRRAPSWRYLRG